MVTIERGYVADWCLLCRWTKAGSPLKTADLLIVPVHENGVHWCLMTVDAVNRTLTYYDRCALGCCRMLVKHICSRRLAQSSLFAFVAQVYPGIRLREPLAFLAVHFCS